eukprot:Pgem_evm1s10856
MESNKRKNEDEPASLKKRSSLTKKHEEPSEFEKEMEALHEEDFQEEQIGEKSISKQQIWARKEL